MIELTEEQRRKLAEANPVWIRDPETNETYVLVRSDVYERIKGLLDDGWAESTSRSAMEVFARDGWEDPRMDVYDPTGSETSHAALQSRHP